jgi:hypothetical protein
LFWGVFLQNDTANIHAQVGEMWSSNLGSGSPHRRHQPHINVRNKIQKMQEKVREARQALELQRVVVESVQGHVDDMYAHLQTLVFTVEGQAEQSSRAKRNLKQLEERERNGVQMLEKMVQHKVERLLKLFPIHRTTSQTRGAFNCIAGLSLPLDGNLAPGHMPVFGPKKPKPAAVSPCSPTLEFRRCVYYSELLTPFLLALLAFPLFLWLFLLSYSTSPFWHHPTGRPGGAQRESNHGQPHTCGKSAVHVLERAPVFSYALPGVRHL